MLNRNSIRGGSRPPLGLISLLTIILSVPIVVLGQAPDTLWTKYYNDGDHNRAKHCTRVLSLSDGGYLLAGRSYNEGFEDFYLVKTDSNGTEEWQSAYDVGIQHDIFGGVAMAENGSYFITGYSTIHGASYCVILKVAANGDTLWSKSYGLGEFLNIIYSDNSTLVAVGLTREFGDNGATMSYLVKIDNDGEVVWRGVYGSTLFVDIAATRDSGYIAVGRIWPWAGIIVKINAEGGQEWRKVFDTPEAEDCFMSVEQAADGGYLVGGWNDFGSLLVKYNAEGDTLWSKNRSRGVPNPVEEILISPVGGFIITGGNGFCLSRIDDLGETVWEFQNEFRFVDAKSVILTDDGGYAVGCSINAYWEAGQSAGLVRTLPDTVVIPFALQAVQEFHDFQRVRLDSMGTWDVAVKNIGRRYAEIDSVSFKGVSPVFGRGFNQPVGIPVNDTNFVPLTFHPLDDTLYSDTASFWCGEVQVLEVYLEGRGIPGNAVEDDGLEIRPTEFGIAGCWPNPFNSRTTISYLTGVETGATRLAVYDLAGRLVEELHPPFLPPASGGGIRSVMWDASGVGAGVYVVRLESPNFHAVRKIVLLK